MVLLIFSHCFSCLAADMFLNFQLDVFFNILRLSNSAYLFTYTDYTAQCRSVMWLNLPHGSWILESLIYIDCKSAPFRAAYHYIWKTTRINSLKCTFWPGLPFLILCNKYLYVCEWVSMYSSLCPLGLKWKKKLKTDFSSVVFSNFFWCNRRLFL